MPSLLRPASFFALALATFVAGCDEDDTEPVYLGVVDGAAMPDSPGPDASPDAPEIRSLTISDCGGQSASWQGSDVASVVRFVASGNNRVLVTLQKGVFDFEFPSGIGCNLTPPSGPFAAGAAAAAPVPSGMVVATEDRTLLLDAAGAEVAGCTSSGTELRLRWLASNNAGKAWGAFVRSPLASLSADTANFKCEGASLPLDANPFAVLALATASSSEDLIVVEQQTASSPLALARYDATGKRTGISPDQPGAPVLCSVTGLVDTDQGILAADGACKQLVLYDSGTLQAVGRAELDGSPRGLAWLPGGTKVLVPVAYPTESGAEAVLKLVDLQQ